MRYIVTDVCDTNEPVCHCYPRYEVRDTLIEDWSEQVFCASEQKDNADKICEFLNQNNR